MVPSSSTKKAEWISEVALAIVLGPMADNGSLHGNDQVPPPPRHPLMARTILVQHHAGQRAARSLAPVRPAARRFGGAAMGLQRQTNPVVAPLEIVIQDQLVPKMPGREIPVPGVEQRQQPHHLVHRRAPRRHPAQAAVVKTLCAVRLEAIAPAPKRPLRHAQHRCRFLLAHLAPLRAPQNLLELHQPYPLQHVRPSHEPPPLSRDVLNRTDHVLPTLDISCVSDSAAIRKLTRRWFRLYQGVDRGVLPPMAFVGAPAAGIPRRRCPIALSPCPAYPDRNPPWIKTCWIKT